MMNRLIIIFLLFCSIFTYSQNEKYTSEYWQNLLDISNEYMKNGMYQNAINSYNQLLENSPDVPEIYNNIGVAYEKNGEYIKAIDYFNKALELDPDFADSINNIANVYIKLELDLDVALSYCIKALSIVEKSGFYDTMADVYNEKGIYEKALQYYEKAINKDSESFSTYLKITRLLIKVRKYDRAMDYIKILEEKDHMNIQLVLIKVKLLKRIGKYLEAHINLTELVQKYNEFTYTKDEENLLKDEIRSYFKTTVWSAALSYYRVINPDVTNITFDEIRPYTKVFYDKEISEYDTDGQKFFINRNFIVESREYGINPDIFDFLNYFSVKIREIFSKVCKKNQEIIKLAVKEYILSRELEEKNISMEDIISHIYYETKCPENGKYILKDGEVICTKHGKLY